MHDRTVPTLLPPDPTFVEMFVNEAKVAVLLNHANIARIFELGKTGANYYIETKNPEEAPGMEEALLTLLTRYDLRATAASRRVLIQSFSAASLKKIHALDRGLLLVQLLDNGGSAEMQAMLGDVTSYAIGIGPTKRAVDVALVAAAHERCLEVHPYTVNETTEMQSLLMFGVDGMFTDFPDRLNAVLSLVDSTATNTARNRRQWCTTTRR